VKFTKEVKTAIEDVVNHELKNLEKECSAITNTKGLIKIKITTKPFIVQEEGKS